MEYINKMRVMVAPPILRNFSQLNRVSEPMALKFANVAMQRIFCTIAKISLNYIVNNFLFSYISTLIVVNNFKPFEMTLSFLKISISIYVDTQYRYTLQTHLNRIIITVNCLVKNKKEMLQ